MKPFEPTGAHRYAKIHHESLVDSGWNSLSWNQVGPEYRDQLAMSMQDVLNAIAKDLEEPPFLCPNCGNAVHPREKMYVTLTKSGIQPVCYRCFVEEKE